MTSFFHLAADQFDPPHLSATELAERIDEPPSLSQRRRRPTGLRRWWQGIFPPALTWNEHRLVENQTADRNQRLRSSDQQLIEIWTLHSPLPPAWEKPNYDRAIGLGLLGSLLVSALLLTAVLWPVVHPHTPWSLVVTVVGVLLAIWLKGVTRRLVDHEVRCAWSRYLHPDLTPWTPWGPRGMRD